MLRRLSCHQEHTPKVPGSFGDVESDVKLLENYISTHGHPSQSQIGDLGLIQYLSL